MAQHARYDWWSSWLVGLPIRYIILNELRKKMGAGAGAGVDADVDAGARLDSTERKKKVSFGEPVPKRIWSFALNYLDQECIDLALMQKL